MSVSLFIVTLLPLIAFVLVDLFASLRWAVAAAFVCAVGEALIMYYSTGEWDELSLLGIVLIGGLGYVSVWRKERIYFKFQPVVIALIVAGFLAYLQFFGESFVYRYRPLMEATAPEALKGQFENENFIALVNLTVNWLIVVIVLDAAVVGYTAARCSNFVWLLANAFAFWILGFLMAIGLGGYLLFAGPVL